MSKIISIATKAAPYEYEQNQILKFMEERLGWDEEQSRKAKFLYDRSGIDKRYSVLQDFNSNIETAALYNKGHDPNVQSRMATFFKEALPLAIQAAKKCISNIENEVAITHLITVSCTGMSAPGLEIQLVKALALKPDIERTSVNFMGCYAAIHALKYAHYIVETKKDAVVLVVSVELCTLHFQRAWTEDNVLANMLFADGAGAAIVTSGDIQRGFEIEGFHSDIFQDGEQHMAWNIYDTGFLMSLSSYVPKLLSTEITGHYDQLFKKNKLEQKDINFWAIHPGGRAIVEAVGKQMDIDAKDLKASFEVLKEYGNMSSVTILFVLEKLLQNQKDMMSGEYGVATAFGPGLTVESLLLKFC